VELSWDGTPDVLVGCAPTQMPAIPSPSPTYDPLFESPWLKWGQAARYAQELGDLIRDWRQDNEPVQSWRADYSARRHGFAVIAQGVAEMPTRWGLLVGDIANNLRASLDHLAWSLVSRGRTPPAALTTPQQGSIYFPITTTREDFNAQIVVPASPKARLKLPGVRRPRDSTSR
jgi:hypothetical protein